MPSVLKSEQFDVGNQSEVGVETSIGSGSRDLFLGEIRSNICVRNGMTNRVNIIGRFRQSFLCRIISIAKVNVVSVLITEAGPF